MNPKVMDAVGLIGRFVSENWESISDQGEINDELENQGFSTREISEAFRWIERNTLGPDDETPPASASEAAIRPPFRILTTLESSKLSGDAHGFLVKFYERGLIDPVVMEDILERVAKSESEDIGVKDIRRLTALALFTRVQSEWRDYLHTTNTLIH